MVTRHPIGIMEGRLLPPVNGQIQAFPGADWPLEFPRAAAAGLDLIEMIYDLDGLEENPLHSAEGVARLMALSAETGVGVRTVCADYFMRRGFIRVDEAARRDSVRVLADLLRRLRPLGCEYVVIPFVDASEVRTPAELESVRRSLLEALEQSDGEGAVLALEMSLESRPFAEFLARVDHPRVQVNYDTGNSAALGYDLADEIRRLGPWLVSVHIKDRIKDGGSVPLGEGDADFDGAFAALREVGYAGPFILQVQRGRDELEHARANAAFVREMLTHHGL